MPLSGKEIEVEEGTLSLLPFVTQFMEEFDRCRWLAERWAGLLWRGAGRVNRMITIELSSPAKSKPVPGGLLFRRIQGM
jgi:hypothetical protein